MPITENELNGYQRLLFSRAATWRNLSLLSQALVAVPAAISIFAADGTHLYYLAGISFLTVIAAFFVERRYQQLRSAGERARRAALVFAIDEAAVSAVEQTSLAEALAVSKEEAAAASKQNYYSADAKFGPARLIQKIEESAYFSRHLHLLSAYATAVIFFTIIFIAIVVAFVSLPSATSDSSMVFARLLLAFLVFVVTSGVASSIIAHIRAWHEAQLIENRSKIALQKEPLLADALMIMTDYNSSVSTAPMIVPFVYNWKEKELNDRWEAHIENLQNQRCRPSGNEFP